MTNQRSLIERLRFDVGSRPGGICEEAANALEFLQREFDCAASIAQRNRDEIERLEQQLDLKLFSRRQMEEDLAIIREWYGEESIDSLLRLKRRAVEPSTGGS